MNAYGITIESIFDQLFAEHLQSVIAVISIIVLRIVWKLTRFIIRSRRLTRASRTARLFDAEQKAIGHARAGHRCEFTSGFGARCTSVSEHADHFYPHARGGATTMTNFVASCASHNLAKGAKMPSVFERTAIQTRRRSYFPAFTSTALGEWA